MAMDATLRTRQLFGPADFSPKALKVVVGAFDAAWEDPVSEVGADAGGVRSARVDLARIMLGLARIGPIDHSHLKFKSVLAYQVRHGDLLEQLAEWRERAVLDAKAPRRGV